MTDKERIKQLEERLSRYNKKLSNSAELMIKRDDLKKKIEYLKNFKGMYLNVVYFNKFNSKEHYTETSLVRDVTGYSKEALFRFKSHKQTVPQKFLNAWADFTEEPESNWVTTKRIKQ